MGGFIDGRFCAPVPEIQKGLICCLPCPMTEFLYPPSFETYYRAAEALNVVSLVLMSFLLITFIALPVEKTRGRYLSYCLIIAGMFMALGFVIPFGAQPDQCYNEITPNDMYSSLTCAFSGAFLISGGLSMAVWIFIRALSMHLQICWDVTPGKNFFYWAQGLGWSVAACFFTITITITGVSFRFGDVCHVNAAHSMQDFWGPLLAISGVATVIQVATFCYCIKVYLQNMFSDEKTETQSSAGLPSFTTTSVRTWSARAVYRRVRKVLWLQWRGITVVIFILVDVIFFSIVFVWLNNLTANAKDDVALIIPLVLCLVQNPTDRPACYKLGQELTVNEATVTAILMMLSIAGIQVFVLLTRSSMFKGWYDLIRAKVSNDREFVSLDAKNAPNYELQKVDKNTSQAPESVFTPVTPTAGIASYGNFRSDTPKHFPKETQREYTSHSMSFSSPRPITRPVTHMDWDPRSTHARGGLGLHPPEYDTKI